MPRELDGLGTFFEMRLAAFTLSGGPALAFAGQAQLGDRHHLVEPGDGAQDLVHEWWNVLDERAGPVLFIMMS